MRPTRDEKANWRFDPLMFILIAALVGLAISHIF
jgi:hypothetical protein